jgi:protein-L-isoaspartate(D-aspartate) O-methyltransferase
VPREKFVLPLFQEEAYEDYPLPIGLNQTISQPTTVAIMTEALNPTFGDKILEIGAGSGYQAAILSEIVGPGGNIITIEILPELVKLAKRNLKAYENVKVLKRDGSKGYKKEAPYDRILVAAAAPVVPEALFEQLKEGGILLVPVGEPRKQKLLKITKQKKGARKVEDLGAFIFVPLVGEF